MYGGRIKVTRFPFSTENAGTKYLSIMTLYHHRGPHPPQQILWGVVGIFRFSGVVAAIQKQHFFLRIADP